MEFLLDILWSVATVCLLGGGFYFSCCLKFPQLHLIKILKTCKNKSKNTISPLASLSISLAARIGVGSLAGIAIAIYIGGPGSIFWMWIITFITAINAYCESYLGAKYQKKDGDEYKGGPAYYIDKGLKNKLLAKCYAIFIILAYVFGFMTIQANTITKSISDFLPISPLIIGILIATLSGMIIIKGLDGIVSATSKIVPLMGISYIAVSSFIIFKNIDQLPAIFNLIITSAFNVKAAGMGIFSTFIIGIQRGIFSTEAGLGSGAIASSTSAVNDKVGLGLLQILGIYFTSFVICTSTALLILLSDYQTLNLTNLNGIELTQYALTEHLGQFGNIFLILSIFLFAFSTIIAGYYYGESNLKYLLKKDNPTMVKALKGITILLLLIGSIISPTILWTTIDLLVVCLAIMNMYSLLKLRKEIIQDYRKSLSKSQELYYNKNIRS